MKDGSYAVNRFEDIIGDHLARNCEIDHVSLMTLRNFSCLRPSLENSFMKKQTFNSIQEIPPCTKYPKPKKLDMYGFQDQFSGDAMEICELPIIDLINIEHVHFLNLHPVRYDKVKREISEGAISYPIVGMEYGIPHVKDGRHRIIALHKYGFEHVKCSVPIHEKEEILEILNSCQ